MRRTLLSLTALLIGAMIVGGALVREAASPAGDASCVVPGTPRPRTPHKRHRLTTRPIEIACGGAQVTSQEGLSGGFPFRVEDAPEINLPSLVDSNSPAFWDGDQLYVFSSALGETYRSEGTGVTDLGDSQLVSLPQPDRPGTVWLEAVWRDAVSGTLYGWYHFEPADLDCLTAPIIGAAVSDDAGLTWQDRGFVLESGYDIDCDAANGYFVGGNGDFTVLPSQDKRFFYFVYTNYGGPLGAQGVSLARSTFEGHGQPGTVFKFSDGAWDQPGLGGKETPVLPAAADWRNEDVDSFWGPSVQWNTYVNSYVALLNHAAGENWNQEGVYLSFSRDLVHWSQPQKIMDSSDWYPEALGLGSGETDSLEGHLMRLYVGGASLSLIEFDLSASPPPALLGPDPSDPSSAAQPAPAQPEAQAAPDAVPDDEAQSAGGGVTQRPPVSISVAPAVEPAAPTAAAPVAPAVVPAAPSTQTLVAPAVVSSAPATLAPVAPAYVPSSTAPALVEPAPYVDPAPDDVNDNWRITAGRWLPSPPSDAASDTDSSGQ